MTHYAVIVLDDGMNVDTLVEKYDEQIKVPPYPVVVSDEELQRCAKYYRETEPEIFGNVDDVCEIYLAKSVDWCGFPSIKNPETQKVEKYSTYNPLSKYDYYTIVKSGFEKSGLPDFIPYAFVTPDGEWHSRGRMGWWAMSFDDMPDEEWEEIWKDTVKNYKGKFTWIDCHI
jgi:hypothetical protein